MRRGRKNDTKRHSEYEDTAPPSAGRLGQEVESMLEVRLTPLQQALAALSLTDRAVLMLRDGEQMSAREVAEAMSITEAAVKSRLHRARQIVKARLA